MKMDNDVRNHMVQIMNEDFETFKNRGIKFELSDFQLNVLKMKAYSAGVEDIGSFITAMIGDLTSCHSNGSDEREMMDNWYERCFGNHHYYAYFKFFLYENKVILGEMIRMIKDKEIFDMYYQSYCEENGGMNLENREECEKVVCDIVDKGEEL